MPRFMAPGIVGAISIENPQLDAARGITPNLTTIAKFGRDLNVTTTAKVMMALPDNPYPGWLTAAAAIRVKAGGNTNDTAAGTGARTMRVVGLDENWAEAEETLTLAGASASAATTTTFIRVFRAYVENVGTYGGTNAGDIELETTGGASVALLTAGGSQTQLAFYSVPAGKTAYLTEWRTLTEGTKAVTYHMFQRRNADVVSAPFTAARLVGTFAGAEGAVVRRWAAAPQAFPAKTDIYVTAQTSTGSSAAVTSFDLFLLDD